MIFTKHSLLMKLKMNFNQLYDWQITDIEIRVLFIAASWDIISDINISSETDKAIKSHDDIVRNRNALMIYTDDSEINESIEAAAVSLYTETEKKAYLSSDTHFTVYSGELYSILMTMKIAHETELNSQRPLIIFTDNQVSIQSINESKNQSGQYILRCIQKLYQEINCSVKVHWIPAHHNIPENEVVNILVKETAEEISNQETAPCTQISTPPEMNFLITVMRAQLRMRALKIWTDNWTEERVSRIFWRLISHLTKQSLLKFWDLWRAFCSALIQMWTEKIDLKNYLHRIDVKENNKCQCRVNQTVQHILLHCQLQKILHNRIWTSTSASVWQMNLHHLLEDNALTLKAAEFMMLTELLSQFRHVQKIIIDSQDEDQW